MALSAARIEAGTPDTWLRYRDNLARHLIGISRDFQSRLHQSLSEECGFENLRLSFGPLLAMIWKRTPPLGDVAQQLGISGQAASQLANLIEDAGYLERVPNPLDRRSKLLKLTPRGEKLVGEAVRITGETEREYAALAGPKAYGKFTGALSRLYRGLDLHARREPEPPARASHSVAVLVLIAERIQSDLMEATTARGHGGLKMSHGRVLPLIGPEGGRIHEIARIQHVSRQAMSATTQDLQSLGYLQREPDPRDRRGAVLKLTPRGIALIEDAVAALDDQERGLLEILGKTQLAELQRVARNLYRALHLEAEVFETGATAHAPPSRGGTDALHRSGREIEDLAERLRQWLGRNDAARLATVLERRTKRMMT